MRKLFLSSFAFLYCLFANAQDNCGSAPWLCNNQTVQGSTIGSSAQQGETINCGDGVVNNSVWFRYSALQNGSVTVTVNAINNNPGLEMQAFTGSCGSLSPTIFCASGSSATGGSMSMTISSIAGTIYYIMVDGTNSNAEAFNIVASAPPQNILGAPLTGFDPQPSSGCSPLNVLLVDTTKLQGGTNIRYSWQIDGGAYRPSTGNDTTVNFTFVGLHSILLRSCNNECGCVSITRDIASQDLISSITATPTTSCLGSPIQFNGSAEIQPDPPYTDPGVSAWLWDFNDPASGSNNFASGQSVSHIFVSNQTTFQVRLIVYGLCGPDTSYTTITQVPRPIIQTVIPATICQGTDLNVSVNAQGSTPPYFYSWNSSSGTIACDTCSGTAISGLPVGGPYTVSVTVSDISGCSTDSTTTVNVNPIPTVTANGPFTVCKGSTVQLNANLTAGNAPINYSWTPSAGLSNSSDQNPTVVATGSLNFCVTATDAIGCSSAASCTSITTYPTPTIAPATTNLCASSSNLQNTFTVNGAAAGSVISWTTSADYSLITNSTADSAAVTANFPQGIAATYQFTAIIHDAVTGCIDTVNTTFTVSNNNNLIVSTSDTICTGATANLSASGSSNYAWTANPSQVFSDSTLANQSVSPTVTTTYTVTGTTGSCTATKTVTITVAPPPAISVNPNQPACIGSTVTLSATVTTGIAPYSYQWTPATGLDNPTIQFPTLTATGNQTYCVTLTDATGCTSTAACVAVTVNTPPTIAATQSTVCASDPVPTNTLTISGLSPGSSISWSTSAAYSNIVSATSDSTSITANFPTNTVAGYSFSAIVVDVISGCIDTLNYTVQVNNPNNLTVSSSQNICKGSSITISANGSSAYAWTATPSYAFLDSTLSSQSITLDTSTVFYVTGTTGGCSSTLPITITVNPIPDISVVPIAPLCGCDTIQLSGTTSTANPIFTWTNSNNNSIFNPSNSTTSAFVCPGDILTLEVVESSTNCRIDSSIIIAVSQKPAAQASINPAIICPGSATITLDATGSTTIPGTTYTWSSTNPAVSINNPNALITTAQVNGNAIFNLVVTNANGCDSSAQVQLNVHASPVINATNSVLCTSDPVLQSTISISGASAGSNYNWSTVSGCNPSTPSGASSTFDFSGCGAGNYPFSVIVTDSQTGCIDTLNQSVTITNGVVLSLITDTTVCEGSSFQISASGANNYSWSNGQTGNALSLSGLTTAGSPYAYTVTGTVGSCTSTATVNVHVTSVFQISPINGPDTVCGNTQNTSYSVTPSGNAYLWTISGGTIVSGQGTDNITVNWGAGPAGTLNVSDAGTNTCQGLPQSAQIVIQPIPVLAPVISGLATLCQGQSANYQTNGLPGSTYNWSVSGGQITGNINDSTVSVNWNSSGTGTLTVIETTANGCVGPAGTFTVTLNAQPAIPVITGQTAFCQNGSGIYTTPYHPGSVFNWNIIGGSLTPIGSNTDSVNAVWSNSGTNTIELIETDLNGCVSNLASLSVNIAQQPISNITNRDTAICQGANLNLNASSSIGNLAWTTTGSGSFSNNSIATPIYSTGNIDTGLVIVTLIASNGICPSDTDSLRINISGLPVISVSSSDDTICGGSNVTLVASGLSPYTYAWTPTGQNGAVINVSPSTTTTYSVTASNLSGCSVTKTITITVQPAGLPYAGNDLIACIGDIVQISGSQQYATGLHWTTTGSGSFSPNDTASNIFYNPGLADTLTGITTIILTTTGGCANGSDTVLINYLPSPTVYAGLDTIIPGVYSGSFSLPLVPVVQNAPGVIWTTTGTGTFIPNATTPSASYVPSEQDYQQDSILLSITATGGCFAATDYLVIEFKPFVIPNVFTPYPASPGKNDFFVINDLPANAQLKIWDRWGVLVFESTNYQNNWDAANLNADTYYYILSVGNKGYKGWVQVFRDK